ncbi:hypothetical protein NC652_009026 [Populus alba x Populus x berolinensis]|nr:hypothetical protein NC652_009026 [Populus alba x Populus x berolinensis]
MAKRGMTENGYEMVGLRGEKQRKRDSDTVEREPAEGNGRRRWGSGVERG